MSTTAPETVLQSRPTYSPTSYELTNAVSAILKHQSSSSSSSSDPSVKEVLAELQKENPTWKLQERRVKKFVNKAKNTAAATSKELPRDSRSHNNNDDNSDDDSVAIRMAKSISKKTLGGVGAVFKRGKKKEGSSIQQQQDKSAPSSPPAQILTTAGPSTPDTTAIVSPVSSVGIGEETTNVQSPKVDDDAVVVNDTTTGETTEKPVSRNLEAVYEDDNEGSKEEPCCGACMIL